jgi:hypothetical protein
MPKINTFYFTLIFAIIAMFGLYLMLHFSCFGVSNGNGGRFCEAARDALILQPSNSWSNLGFVFFGLLAAWQITYRKDAIVQHNAFSKSTFFAKFLTSMMVLLGPCSMAMHATETSLGGLFDMNSMYLIAGFMVSYASVRYFKLNHVYFVLIYAICMLFGNVSPMAHHFINIDFFLGNLAFGFMCFLGVLIEFLNIHKYKVHVEKRYIIFCVLSFVVAFIIWNFGVDGSCFCDPYSPFQLHAVWHILCALAVYFLFRFYTSEDETKTSIR